MASSLPAISSMRPDRRDFTGQVYSRFREKKAAVGARGTGEKLRSGGRNRRLDGRCSGFDGCGSKDANGKVGLGKEGFGVVAADAVFTGELGFGESAFGFAEDDEGGAAAADGEAEAGGEGGGFLADGERAGEDGLADAMGEETSAFEIAAGQGEEELVFAGASDEVVAAELTAEADAELGEDAVADFVAIVVVDAGEVVEVEEHEAEVGAHALDAVGFLKDEAEEGFAVPEAGEAVVGGVIAELGGLLLDLAGEGEDALGDTDANPEIGGVGGGEEEVVATGFKGGAEAVVVLAAAEQDDPGAVILLGGSAITEGMGDSAGVGRGQIDVEEGDGGGLHATEGGEGLGGVVGDLHLIAPGLEQIEEGVGGGSVGGADKNERIEVEFGGGYGHRRTLLELSVFWAESLWRSGRKSQKQETFIVRANLSGGERHLSWVSPRWRCCGD